MTGREQDAKDVVQDSLLNAFLRLGQFERRADLRTWLHRIVVNCALDHLRSRRRRPDISDPRPLSDVVDIAASSSPDPERLVASADCRRQVATAMNAMSPLERVRFALRHFEGCSISEIAQTVGIGQSAAKQHIFRAVRKIRLALASAERAVSHLGDEALVLHYYGEDGPGLVAIERHLRTCAQCAGAYEALARTLDAVTPPEHVEPEDDTLVIRQMIRDRLRDQSSLIGVNQSAFGETWGVALVWLVPLAYPLSLQALFSSGQSAQEHLGFIPLVAISLFWACAGPFLAVFALNRMAADRRGERASTRVLFAGALLAATSPALYLLVARLNVSLSLGSELWSWYGVIALGSLVALFRWPRAFSSRARFSDVHRLSAVILTVFVLGHVLNQALAFVSVPAYTAMRSVMRVASQEPAIYTLIVAAVGIQLVTGVAMGLKNARAGAAARNLQAVSGWYLAAFLLIHVFSGLLVSQPPPASTTATAVDQLNLLASPRAAASLPFLLLGVTAFLFHVGVYAHLAAMAYLAEAWVRRLSYAGALVGTTVVVTVGLALFGIHVTR
jgi:RNA polymerase sigma-70 factor, ECF subfamily